ncbi:MAG: phage head-tail connector protein [Clostridia bacterium]|nr:phage head-tail connector protein [Clostridia bacterium]
MTDLEMLKKLTGESDDDLLSLLLQESQARLLSLCNRTKMIDALRPACRQWALVAYNRMGMEGETSRSEGGLTSSFAEIPQDIDLAIKRYRLGRVSGHAYEAEAETETDGDISAEAEDTGD